ncbi:hypothetical protein KNE206_57120 [Kitasatospora sp. NE20-6]|uniref:WhiB family transcriptional regulator n=1 Tax=Kitasatospora sp. NE20-6 TaxID=2859066 RepID=UPI0034DC6227
MSASPVTRLAALRLHRRLQQDVGLPADEAVCRYVDPEIFFRARRASSQADASFDIAKEVCQVCPIREACLQTALRNGESDGVWGGFTPGERRRFSGQMRDFLALGEEGVELVERTLLSGGKIQQRHRPGVVLMLLDQGWYESAIAEAMDVAPGTVRAARETAERIQLHCRAVGIDLPSWARRLPAAVAS